jgi:predicted transcriptional regulator
MSFESLNIEFQSLDELFSDVSNALEGKSSCITGKNTLTFDSPKTFWKFFTNNKLEILVAISKFKPESVYALAKFLGREAHHVLKDCNQLKSFGMISMLETKGSRKQIRPVLTFEYDLIKVDSKLKEVLPISSNASQYLLDAV